MTGKEYINKEKPNLVDNWSYPAELLSYGQIAEMLDSYHEYKLKLLGIVDVVGQSEQLLAVAEYVYNHFDDSSSKTAKDYLQDFLSQ